MTIGGKFFKELREVVLRKSELTARLIPHYENLLHWQDQLATLLVDTEEYAFDILYDDDSTGGYSDGEFIVQIYPTNRYYRIKLISEDRMIGYCTCSSDLEGYNKEHKCTGVACDWYAPSFEVELITVIGNGSFEGDQRDLWEAEKKWKEANKEYKERDAKAKVKTKLDNAKQYMEMAKMLQAEAKEMLEDIQQGK